MNDSSMVVFFNTKGGTGKTTLADMYAHYCERHYGSVSFMNLDAQPGAQHEHHYDPDAQVTVVDTPGRIEPAVRKVLAAADVVVVPIIPSAKSLKVLPSVLEEIPDSAHTLVVLNQFDSRLVVHREIKKELSKTGLDYLTIPSSITVERAALEGKPVLGSHYGMSILFMNSSWNLMWTLDKLLEKESTNE